MRRFRVTKVGIAIGGVVLAAIVVLSLAIKAYGDLDPTVPFEAFITANFHGFQLGSAALFRSTVVKRRPNCVVYAILGLGIGFWTAEYVSFSRKPTMPWDEICLLVILATIRGLLNAATTVAWLLNQLETADSRRKVVANAVYAFAWWCEMALAYKGRWIRLFSSFLRLSGQFASTASSSWR